ncbi:hypothetical protein [Geoglobus acetivorans]|uniref:Uncharacterized protein n=1 Tax=Geoglobus acetivorans TaxID=565033 RepID=A0A0A7GFP5_GEOAI|nr:hypothetical protein GACE_1821 [Geoglobus acetivorans]
MKTGRIAININGDFEDRVLIEKAVRAEKVVGTVWIGDSDFFRSPFHVAELIAENTELNVGFGILRATKCRNIISELGKFRKYGDRIIVGIAAGDGGNVGMAERCIRKIKEKYDFPVVAGGTGKIAIRTLSNTADGILLNHISPEHVTWALRYSCAKFNAAYGPALILPSEFEQDLLLASALVMGSSKSFLSEMGYQDVFERVARIDLLKLILKRQKGDDLSDESDFIELLQHRDFLLEKFTLSGTQKAFAEKLSELMTIVDQVILSDPFFRDENFDEKLAKVLKYLKMN